MTVTDLATLPGARYRMLYATALKTTEEELFGFSANAIQVTPPSTVDCGTIPQQGSSAVRRRSALGVITGVGASAMAPPVTVEEALVSVEDPWLLLVSSLPENSKAMIASACGWH
jgi:hypothetical protein